MQTINESLVDDETVELPEKIEESQKSCNIPVPRSFSKQTVLFHNGLLSYTTVASQVVFIIAMIILMIYGLKEWMHIGKVVSLNDYMQLFSLEELSKLFLTEAFPEQPLPVTI